MTDTTLRYFQEEMRHLHESGERFAKSHPDEAKLLSMGTHTDRDPYVERLFEGFAFLTARIRERLDDEMPQYTDGLLGLLWPHLLRPVPSLSVVEFRPTPGLVTTTTSIPRGSEVRSAPVGEENTVCRFVTTQDVRLQPFHISSAALAWPNPESSTLTVSVRLARGVEFNKLSPSPLRIYLHADKAAASLLHLFLTRHVSRVRLTPAVGGEMIELTGQQWVMPAGFDANDGLLPYSPYTFHGFRLLQEYFAFRQKFWFVDVFGVERLGALPTMSGFEMQFAFDRPFPETTPIKAENLRLFCSPVVNLFAQDAVPLHVDHRASEYRVIADLRQPKSVDVYDVNRVSAEQDGSRRRYDYAPFLSTGREAPRDRWYSTTRRAVGNRVETFVTLGGARAEELRPETLSLELQCTNGGLPQERLREGMIREAGPDVPRVASLELLVRPTASLRPPTHEHRGFYWRLVSHLSLAHRSVFSREGLVDLLSLYNWSDDAANRRRIAGIRDVKWRPKEIVERRACVRGAEVTVEIQDDHFADEGDVCLFGAVLSHVFRSYATINSFVHLAIVLVPFGARYEWKPDRGTLPLS